MGVQISKVALCMELHNTCSVGDCEVEAETS